MKGRRHQLIEQSGVDPVSVGRDLHRFHSAAIDGLGEEPSSGFRVPARREQDVDDLAELVDGPEQVAPSSSDLQLGLIHSPAITHGVLRSEERRVGKEC